MAEVWVDDYKKYYNDRIGHDLGNFGKEKEILAHLKEMKEKYAVIRNRTEYMDKISEAEVIRWVKLYIIT